MFDIALIGDLPPETLRILLGRAKDFVRQLEAQIEHVESQAARSQADRERMRRNRDRAGRVWEAVERHTAAGLSHDQAVAAVAHETAMRPYDVEFLWHREAARNHKRRRQQRDLEIMRLYRRGHSDAEIAERVELHPRSVNRRIHEILAETERPQPGFLARWRAAAE